MDLNYFVNGSISGMFGVIISHPIDTIKTSIQDRKPIKYNPKFLYRGIFPALYGIGLEKAIVFGSYNNAMKYLSHKIDKKYAIPLSGLTAGLSASLVVTPVERLKILSQTGQKINIKSFYPKSLFKGITATFTREMPGFSIYFTTYNYLKNKYYFDKNISLPVSFLFGGISGMVSWFGIYPQDVIKTRIQSIHTKTSFMTMAKIIFNEQGIKGFFKGMHLALLRAIPLHAGTFMMMEIMNKINY